jgi:eukaryotic-like serine/threonine-protein kinase
MSDTAGCDGPPPLPPGAPLAPGYRVVAHLRRGHDLDVYDLWSEERGCRCVGKTVRPDRLGSRDARARLLREGRLLQRLTHPHIVRAYEVHSGPTPLVILETLPGETLARLIDRRAHLSPMEIAHLGSHLCSAIGYLHRQGTLHLDLKPSNIIATHGMAKVLDLSLARPPGRARGGIGTAGYMAPEQIAGGELGPAADVWGIGAVLYEVAAGEPPCDPGEGSLSDFRALPPCHPLPVRRRRRGLGGLGATIDRCLQLDPAARPSAADLTTALAGILGSGVAPPLLGARPSAP